MRGGKERFDRQMRKLVFDLVNIEHVDHDTPAKASCWASGFPHDEAFSQLNCIFAAERKGDFSTWFICPPRCSPERPSPPMVWLNWHDLHPQAFRRMDLTHGAKTRAKVTIAPWIFPCWTSQERWWTWGLGEEYVIPHTSSGAKFAPDGHFFFPPLCCAYLSTFVPRPLNPFLTAPLIPSTSHPLPQRPTAPTTCPINLISRAPHPTVHLPPQLPAPCLSLS